MGDTQKDLLRVKLDQLQCHFTWAPQKETIDLYDMKQRLEDSIQLDVKYQDRSYNQLAFVNCLQGNCEEAIQNLKEAEKILKEQHQDEFEKRIIVTYGNNAWVYYHMEQLEDAQSYLDKLEMVCKLFPEASQFTAMIPEVYGEKGWSLLSSAAQYYEEAKECFKKALEKDPNNIEWNIGYATVLSRLEWFSGTPEHRGPMESVKWFERVLELDPNDSVSMVLLALKLQRNGKNVEALTLVERALQKSPDLPYVLRYAAQFYRLCNNVDKALELLERGLEISPHSTFIHHKIGQCYRTKLDRMLNNPLTKDPCNPAFQQKAELINKCKYHFEKSFKKESVTSVKPSLDFAAICSLNEEYDKAQEIYSHLLTLECIRPENKQAIRLAVGLFQLNRKNSESKAIRHFLEGVKVNYNSVERKKCRENLEKLAARQLCRNPRESEALGVRGFLHQLDGEKYEAIECFKKALEFDPDNDEYLSALCELRLSIEGRNNSPYEN
ncbi:interferon-induced protein with tetratricopeptide repeats 5-like isoform X3 [Stegostoma tigrinum]|uniref:interferon-induced protein with tetratricopeptide repeats 5-like isoform X3 n=1 Tax=Stegostoma tigrinum TaxID=3053191 RepID=UPI00202AF9AE|nr:interferon-induced protein with tetratricopeptide repeats 5-like isoform X3 [Stegostoma tigrinum]XP_059508909.1 interferon-induced protein with tetratricopeptide repeats 5-like isoform X3 [Stegostoma tigrinum]